MRSPARVEVAETFTQLLAGDAALPPAALGVLAEHAQADLSGRAALAAALLTRPELPPATAAQLALPRGRRAPMPVTVAYLQRAEHPAAHVADQLARDDRPRVLLDLATSPTAPPAVLTVLADLLPARGGEQLAWAVLGHRATPEPARRRALRAVDGHAQAAGLDGRPSHRSDKALTALRNGLHHASDAFAVAAAGEVANPALLAEIARRPLPEAAQRRVIAICLDGPLTAGRHVPELAARVLTALADHAAEPIRREAAAVLAAHHVVHVTGHPIDRLVRLAATPARRRPRPIGARRWVDAAAHADGEGDTGRALAGALTAGLGDDTGTWRALLGLAGDFTGSVDDLIIAAAGVAAAPA